VSEVPTEGGLENRGKPLSFLAAASWTVALTLLLGVAVAFTEMARAGASTDLVNVTACHALAYSLVLFVMLRLYAPAVSVRQALALRPASPLHAVLAAVAGAGLYPALSELDELFARRFPHSDEDVAAASKLLDATTTPGRVMLVVSLVMLMPVAEELFFRGMLFGGIKKGRTAPVAIGTTALCFMVSQQDPRGFASCLALGLLLGWLRAQSGSVVSSIAAHAAFFLVPILPIALGRPGAAEITYSWRWMAAGIAAGALAALAASWLAARDRAARDASAADE
jgi:membrane protease YdiL (CAAX protease family)